MGGVSDQIPQYPQVDLSRYNYIVIYIINYIINSVINPNNIVMAIDRRSFLKFLGLTGGVLALGRQSHASPIEPTDVEFYGILYDSTRCAGCQGCEFACAAAHDLPAPEDSPEVGVVRKTNEFQRTVVNYYDSPNGTVFVKKQCMQCNQPACDAACLTRAMHKTEEGPVIWRGDKCMGCRYCMISCPFDIPKFEYQSTNPRIVKCDMCYDRITVGELPACVTDCPAEALTFGKRRDLITEARKRIVENPGQYHDHIYGEHEAGGTGVLYLSSVPFEYLGFDTRIQKESFPSLTKGFISAIAPVDIVLPAVLLGINEAVKGRNKPKQEEL